MSEPAAKPDALPEPAPQDAAEAGGGARLVAREGKGKKKKQKGERSVETLYRVLYRNHLELTGLADNKANMMVGINGLLASAAFGYVAPRLADGRVAEALPALIPLVGCGLSLACAILSARPRLSTQAFSFSGVRQSHANLMFFGHFSRLAPEEYVAGLRELETQPERLHEQMGRDIHSLGLVLAKKYRLLRASYTALLATVIASAAGIAFRLAAR